MLSCPPISGNNAEYLGFEYGKTWLGRDKQAQRWIVYACDNVSRCLGGDRRLICSGCKEAALCRLHASRAVQTVIGPLPCFTRLLFDLGHLLAAASLVVGHRAGAWTSLNVDQLGFAGITTVTVTCFSGHVLKLLFSVSKVRRFRIDTAG